jgi:acetyl/propionyl-CoA carboxylase alpha subunit
MNTRLQVEHPVTEQLTGIDIVSEQIRIAYGRKLSYSQKDIRWRGAAIECRINTEDPYNNFLPSTGLLTMVQLPTGPGIRVDSGVYVGFEISPYYDPLIAKLIAWGESRQQAIIRIRRALEEYRIVGVRTNIPFHQTMMASYPFISGNYDTRFVEEQFPEINAAENRELYLDIAALLATLVNHKKTEQKSQFYKRSSQQSNWKWASIPKKVHK